MLPQIHALQRLAADTLDGPTIKGNNVVYSPILEPLNTPGEMEALFSNVEAILGDSDDVADLVREKQHIENHSRYDTREFRVVAEMVKI